MQGHRKVPRSGAAIYRDFWTYLFFIYEETALVASRYIEGNALTLRIYTVTVTKQHVLLLVNSNSPIAVIQFFTSIIASVAIFRVVRACTV